jgi:hypothetical protein
MPREPAAAFSGTGMESFAGADSFHSAESASGRPKVAAADASSRSGQSAMTALDQAAPKSTLSAAAAAYAEHIRQIFAGTGRGIPTDAQIGETLAHLPAHATPQGFAAFLRAKLSRIRHAGTLVSLAQEYAHELHYRPRGPPSSNVRSAMAKGRMGVRRRKADQRVEGADS